MTDYVTKEDLEKAVSDYLKKCEGDGLMVNRRLTPVAKETIRKYMFAVLTVPSIVMALALWMWDKNISASAVNDAVKSVNDKIVEFQINAKTGLEKAQKAGTKADQAFKDAESVLANAKEALSKAQSASETADAAESAANVASGKANAAAVQADLNLVSAKKALESANNALIEAKIASDKANDALSQGKNLASTIAASDIVESKIRNAVEHSKNLIRPGDAVFLKTKAADGKDGNLTFLPGPTVGGAADQNIGKWKLSQDPATLEMFTIERK